LVEGCISSRSAQISHLIADRTTILCFNRRALCNPEREVGCIATFDSKNFATNLVIETDRLHMLDIFRTNSINMASTTVVVCAVAALICYLTYQHHTQRDRIPGPRGLPLLGNIQDLPPPDVPEYQHWLKHKDLYGGISSVNVLGLTLILIHDKGLAHDLLEQPASKTAGRPTMVMANELCGYASIVLCQDYTSEFRRARKFLHRELGTKVLAAQFQDAQESEVARQLVRALDEPEGLLEHFRT
jgi:hypothetical protein